MIPVLMVWLYFALLFSLMQWPNRFAMLISFVLLGAPPLFLLYRLLVVKRKQQRLTAVENEENTNSVQVGVREVNNDDAGNNQ